MLRASQDVIGLPVIQWKTDRQLGSVCDLLFDQHQWRALTLSTCGGWWPKRQYIRRESVLYLGRDAVLVFHQQPLTCWNRTVTHWWGVRSGRFRFRGKLIRLSTGALLGRVENVYFHQRLGTLMGYELSEGWLNDWQYGRRILHWQGHLPTQCGGVWVLPTDRVHLRSAR